MKISPAIKRDSDLEWCSATGSDYDMKDGRRSGMVIEDLSDRDYGW